MNRSPPFSLRSPSNSGDCAHLGGDVSLLASPPIFSKLQRSFSKGRMLIGAFAGTLKSLHCASSLRRGLFPDGSDDGLIVVDQACRTLRFAGIALPLNGTKVWKIYKWVIPAYYSPRSAVSLTAGHARPGRRVSSSSRASPHFLDDVERNLSRRDQSRRSRCGTSPAVKFLGQSTDRESWSAWPRCGQVNKRGPKSQGHSVN